MRILHVINTVDPSWGGTVTCVRQLGTAMLRRGHSVEVASLSDPPTNAEVAKFPVKSVPLGPGVLKYSFSLRAIRWFLQNASSYDVFVVNGLWQFQGIVAAAAAWLFRKPYVVYVHGMLGPLGKSNYWKFVKKFLYWTLVEYWVVRGANFTIFTSREEAVMARGFFPFYRWREAVVENGVDIPPASASRGVPGLVARHPAVKGKIIVLFLGRLTSGKGCDILIEAFAKTFQRDAHYHLMIVGPDDNTGYTAKLKNQASELGIGNQVTWTGLLLGEDKEAAFSIASVFVSPSHHENFGMAVVEALCRGLPVIATKKINIHSMLSSMSAAIICDDTVEGISQALREWMAMTKDAKESLRTRQLEAFERLFSIERAAEKLDFFLVQAIGRR
jgi:glycosyltransferase involved in cell wall biosynthesis